MRPLLFTQVAFATALAISPPASGQQLLRPYDQKVKAGQATRVYSFWRCEDRSIQGGLGGTARNGTVSMRQAIQDRCGRIGWPATEMIYTPSPGFRGRDEVWVFGNGGARAQIIVMVE